MSLSFDDILSQKLPVVLDGAMGTELMRRLSLSGDECMEHFCLSHPDIVQEIHREYEEAGAQIIHANTFGANQIRLAQHGLESEVNVIIKQAVTLAKLAARDKALVFGSMGPSGVSPAEFHERIEDIRRAFDSQARKLVENKVDGITIETMTSLTEALMALEAVRQSGSALPVVVSLVWKRSHSGFTSLMGDNATTVVHRLEDAGVDAIGANCGEGSADYPELAEELLSLTHLPVFMSPSAGMPQQTDKGLVYPESVDDYLTVCGRLVKSGVRGIGGCCGVGPQHIARLTQSLRTA